MKAYRVTWIIACCGLASVGVSSALAISIPAMMTLFTGAVVVIGGVELSQPAFRVDGAVEVPRRALLRPAVRSCFLGGTAAVAVAGLAALLNAWVLLVVGVVAISSPTAVHRLGHWAHDRFARLTAIQRQDRAVPHAVPVIESISTTESAAGLSSLSDTELCQAWRASFSVLEAASTSWQRCRVAAARQKYLDELERRNSEGLMAWLASGPRAAADPSKYILVDPIRRRSIDWDELIR